MFKKMDEKRFTLVQLWSRTPSVASFKGKRAPESEELRCKEELQKMADIWNTTCNRNYAVAEVVNGKYTGN